MENFLNENIQGVQLDFLTKEMLSLCKLNSN